MISKPMLGLLLLASITLAGVVSATAPDQPVQAAGISGVALQAVVAAVVGGLISVAFAIPATLFMVGRWLGTYTATTTAKLESHDGEIAEARRLAGLGHDRLNEHLRDHARGDAGGCG